jgi:dephospho-CoA kinase
MRTSLKIALTGNTGVGKDTFVQTLRASDKFDSLQEIKLSTPLYEVQNYIYQVCKKEKEYFTQDGVLLNFLGKNMREINPNIIKDYFLAQLDMLNNINGVIICSDARPQDLLFIKSSNFLIIKIIASTKLCIERRIARGDTSLGSLDHSTEKSASQEIAFDYSIENNGKLNIYQQAILKLVGDLYDSHW